MQLLLVQVQVKADQIAAFVAATRSNVESSLREPGVMRFELCQVQDDPSRFVIIEGYRDQSAVLAHKETAHYRAWRDTVAEMMASPRIGTRLSPVLPSSQDPATTAPSSHAL